MGQYYKVVILSESGEFIRVWIYPSYGIKLMEHSYQDTTFMKAIEHILSVQGMFYKSRIVWAGDYAPEEKEKEKIDASTDEKQNLYHLASEENPIHKDKMLLLTKIATDPLPYIVNHSKKLFVDKTKVKDIHPLPLLVSEGNGNGGGDYYGTNEELCGTWSRDIISMDSTIPDGYTELECNFK
jgi:hypothetical protein